MSGSPDSGVDGSRRQATGAHIHGLLTALHRLDERLKRAVAAAQVAYGQGASADPYRGLYINQSEVERALGRQPGASPFPSTGVEGDGPVLGPFDEGSRLA